jgi:hypothetical protein
MVLVNRSPQWAALIGLMVLPLANGAQVIFDHPQSEIELAIDQQDANAQFKFKNVSGYAVRILEVRTACDCIQTAVTPDVVEAGQSGSVTLRFHSKLRNGTEVVRATVVADNGESHEISVRAKLRSYIEVKPLSLHWMKGERRDAKEFIVSSTRLAKLHFANVAAMKGSKIEIQRGEDPTSIRVHLTPPGGDAPFKDTLVVLAEVEQTNEPKLYNLQVSAD